MPCFDIKQGCIIFYLFRHLVCLTKSKLFWKDSDLTIHIGTECQDNPGPSVDVTLGMQCNLFLLVTDLKYIGQIKAPGLKLRFN